MGGVLPGEFIDSGIAIIEKSGPAVIAEKKVEIIGLSPTDKVVIQPLQPIPWMNEFGGLNQIYLSGLESDMSGTYIVVKSMYPELKADVLFRYFIIAA